LGGDDGALGNVEATGVAHQVGHDHRKDRTAASRAPLARVLLSNHRACLLSK
jgi:hypothetical protein